MLVLEGVGFLWYYLLYSTLLYDCITITQPALWERNLGTLSGLSAFRDRVPLCALRSLPTATTMPSQAGAGLPCQKARPRECYRCGGGCPLILSYICVVVVSLCLLRLGLQLQQQQLLLPRLVQQIINTTIEL